MRDTLVRTRTRYVALLKALVRRDGLRLASGAAEHSAPPIRSRPTSRSCRVSGARASASGGRITKAGDTRLRWLLVEAAWRILRSPRADAAPLRAWAERIASPGATVPRTPRANI
ncbi:MAG: transposase [Gemmatimonadales bacterium]